MDKIWFLLVITLCSVNALKVEQSNNRISNGAAAREGQFPYAVSIQRLSLISNPTRGHICGGVLITLGYVLTTAYCTYDYSNLTAIVPIRPVEYRVFAGSITLTNDTSPDHVRAISNITVHPQYIGGSAYVNNIALIGLSSLFSNAAVTPIPIPPAYYNPAEDTPCTVAGWGASTTTTTAVVNLQYAEKYVYNQALCTLQYNVQQGPNILPSMMCAASLNAVSASCAGDYGNPLVCNGGLAGLLSISTECYSTSYPEVYVRISNYTTWIRSVTGGASTFQPGVAVLFVFIAIQIITAKIVS